jgi:hypothetical protein
MTDSRSRTAAWTSTSWIARTVLTSRSPFNNYVEGWRKLGSAEPSDQAGTYALIISAGPANLQNATAR